MFLFVIEQGNCEHGGGSRQLKWNPGAGSAEIGFEMCSANSLWPLPETSPFLLPVVDPASPTYCPALWPSRKLQRNGIVSKESLPRLILIWLFALAGRTLPRWPVSGVSLSRMTGFKLCFDLFELMTWYKFYKILCSFYPVKVIVVSVQL